MASRERQRGNGHRLKHSKCHLSIRKHFFYCIQEQVAQKGCRVSILRGIQNLAGHSNLLYFIILYARVISTYPFSP